MVLGRWLQILADGQEIDIGGAHVVHDLMHRLLVLAKPDHDPRLGEHRGIKLFHPLQQAQAMEIPRAGAHTRIEAGHCFKVVVEHIRLGFHNNFKSFRRTFDEIRRQNLDRRLRAAVPYGADRLGKMLGPAILKVIAVNAGDHHMFEAKLLHRIRHTPRLERVKRIRPPGGDITEGAAPRADLPHDHHRRMTLAPAFTGIGASRLFTDGDELVLAHDLVGCAIPLARRRLDANPARLLRLCIVGAVRLFGVALLGDLEITHARVFLR